MSSRSSKFLQEVRRILRLAKKPSRKEINLSMKISVMGIAILGAIGFMVLLLSTLFIGALIGG
ncbi:MAG: protein translocase SEC61 complex subunit gamma [Candidatus Odinarchaeota archaeon]|nr:protein translocase SEC61 complex subunit gamma [Candidatus Odinarchaeota archaeon]